MAGVLPRLALLLFIVGVSGACRTNDKTPMVVAELEKLLQGERREGVSAVVWKDVKSVYQQRSSQPIWIAHKYVTERAAEAVEVLQQAEAHGFDRSPYGEQEISQQAAALASSDTDAPDRFARLAEFELRVTSGLLALGRDVAVGRTKPELISRNWKHRRATPDIAAAFATVVDGDVSQWLEKVQPQHPEYSALKKALADLRGQAARGGWSSVSAPGKKGQAVAGIAERLLASGHLKDVGQGGPAPADLEAAIRSFQDLHGFTSTGKLDAQTRAAMNVPVDERIAQVALNLERWRWMPDDLGAEHFLVNIPQYHLLARENGKSVMDIRVVVGKQGNETPIFSDEMEFVVFSPYWNIPDTIVAGETAPAVARDPGYLARNNIEVLRAGRIVDLSSVNWSDPATMRTLAFRQRPGASNALGHVKFLFPNDHDVYLHDTPADSLFARQGRAFSHGCVRVEEPEVLANYVLRNRRSEWTPTAITQAMHSGVEKHVKLDKKIPVHIVYFTAWVDDNGGLHFADDVYGYDDKQATARPLAPRNSAD